LRLLRNLPASAQQKVLLRKLEDVSGMEECQIPVMDELQNVPASTEGFLHSQNWNFPKEGFILSSSCNNVALHQGTTIMTF
jgi:hypothetical protein